MNDTTLRRLAQKHDLVLRKSRTRNADAFNYGLYAVIDPAHGGTIHAPLVGQPFALTADEARATIEGHAA